MSTQVGQSKATYTQNHEPKKATMLFRSPVVRLITWSLMEKTRIFPINVQYLEICAFYKNLQEKNFFSIKFSIHSIYFHNFYADAPALFSFFPKVCREFTLLGTLLEKMKIKRVSWWKNYENIMTEKKILWRRNSLPCKFLIKRTNLEISRISSKNPRFLHKATCKESDYGRTVAKSMFMALVSLF